jgi:hypothetical protein
METNSEQPGFSGKRLAAVIGGLIAVAILVFVVSSIGSITSAAHATVLYNPLAVAMEVQLDGKTHRLAPGEQKTISIKPGMFKAVATAGGKELVNDSISILAKDKLEGCLINLSGEPMFLWKAQYGTTTEELMATVLPDNPNNKGLNDSLRQVAVGKKLSQMTVVEVDSVTIVGDVKTYPPDQYVITKEWYFGPNEALKESIEVPSGDPSLGKRVAKIFGKRDLLAYWRQEYGGR